MPLWRSARPPIRLLAATVIIDPTWLVASRRAEHGGSTILQRVHFAGAATVLTVGWIAAVTAGMFLRPSGSATAVLGIALPLCLAAILVPHLRMPGGFVAILVAGRGHSGDDDDAFGVEHHAGHGGGRDLRRSNIR